MKFKKLIYLAGPYSASSNGKSVEENIVAARNIAVKLWDAGYAVICPHMNTAHFEKLCRNTRNRDFVDGDLLMVERCDAIVLLPGWEKSKGVIREYARAIEMGVPAVDLSV